MFGRDNILLLKHSMIGVMLELGEMTISWRLIRGMVEKQWSTWLLVLH
jgi:hypothetical protein